MVDLNITPAAAGEDEKHSAASGAEAGADHAPADPSGGAGEDKDSGSDGDNCGPHAAFTHAQTCWPSL